MHWEHGNKVACLSQRNNGGEFSGDFLQHLHNIYVKEGQMHFSTEALYVFYCIWEQKKANVQHLYTTFTPRWPNNRAMVQKPAYEQCSWGNSAAILVSYQTKLREILWALTTVLHWLNKWTLGLCCEGTSFCTLSCCCYNHHQARNGYCFRDLSSSVKAGKCTLFCIAAQTTGLS